MVLQIQTLPVIPDRRRGVGMTTGIHDAANISAAFQAQSDECRSRAMGTISIGINTSHGAILFE